MRRWDWYIRAYYNDAVKYPKEPSGFAIEVGGMTRGSLDLDIDILKKREDIGRVILIYPNGSEESLK